MARVLISMPERFLDEIDSVANSENRTRSELIREALRTYMYRNQVRNSKKAIKNAEILETLLGSNTTFSYIIKERYGEIWKRKTLVT